MLEMVSGARTVLCKGNASSVFLPMTNATNRCAQGDTQSHQPRATACGPRAVEVTSGSREHNPYSLAKGITRMHWILSGTCQMGDTWQVTLPYWPPPPPQRTQFRDTVSSMGVSQRTGATLQLSQSCCGTNMAR